MKKALIVVDVQNDFVEGGSLAVAGGKSVAKNIKDYIKNTPYDLLVFTRDWHIDPGTHFSDNPDYIDSWPPHCVAETTGAEIVDVLNPEKNNLGEYHYINKGEYEASYSGCTEELVELLEKNGITNADIVGIALDYCVKETANDVALLAETTVITNLSVGIHEENCRELIEGGFAGMGIKTKEVDLDNAKLNSYEEKEFLENYNPNKYPGFALTSDLTIFTIKNGELCILLVRRGGHPFKGYWALPGGFVGGNESSEEAATRELEEETGLRIEGAYLEQLKTYSEPDRDPRTRVVSTAYLALIPLNETPRAGDDAVEAHFFPVRDILAPAEGEEIHIAFDHMNIIRDGLERCRNKLEYAPIAASFLENKGFTIADLRRVYEAVWGVSKLHEANFRRKVLSLPDFLIPIGKKGVSQFDTGRSAHLYQLGGTKLLYPPLLRNAIEDNLESDF